MTTGTISALLAVLFLGYAEGLRRFYPSRQTWLRIRSRHGRRAARAMRERIEAFAGSGIAPKLGFLLLGLVGLWIAAAPALDKRWFEVAFDALPYPFIAVVLFRSPGSLRAISERMKNYERDLGEDPDRDLGDDGPGATELAL